MYPTYPYSFSRPIQNEVVRVNGRNGADAFQLAPNSSILLMDETAPIVWLKTTDGAGYPTTVPYEIKPYEEPKPPDYNDLSARIKRLEELINGKPDASTIKHDQTESAK